VPMIRVPLDDARMLAQALNIYGSS